MEPVTKNPNRLEVNIDNNTVDLYLGNMYIRSWNTEGDDDSFQKDFEEIIEVCIAHGMTLKQLKVAEEVRELSIYREVDPVEVFGNTKEDDPHKSFEQSVAQHHRNALSRKFKNTILKLVVIGLFIYLVTLLPK